MTCTHGYICGANTHRSEECAAKEGVACIRYHLAIRTISSLQASFQVQFQAAQKSIKALEAFTCPNNIKNRGKQSLFFTFLKAPHRKQTNSRGSVTRKKKRKCTSRQKTLLQQQQNCIYLQAMKQYLHLSSKHTSTNVQAVRSRLSGINEQNKSILNLNPHVQNFT